jgi:hypothetical protein
VGVRARIASVAAVAPRTYWVLWWGTLINRLGNFVVPMLTRVCPLQFPRGVHKYRSIEDANADRERWEEANFRAFQERKRAKASRP